MWKSSALSVIAGHMETLTGLYLACVTSAENVASEARVCILRVAPFSSVYLTRGAVHMLVCFCEWSCDEGNSWCGLFS